MLSEKIKNTAFEANTLMREGQMTKPAWLNFIAVLLALSEVAKAIERDCTPIEAKPAHITNVIPLPRNFGGGAA